MSLKKLTLFITGFVFCLGLSVNIAGVNAAEVLSIRATQPKSPTNQTGFNVVFVALDISNRPITVQCFKKGPTEADFIQFGPSISLPAGGNTGVCEVTSAQINNSAGDYQFKVSATAGTDTASDTVVVKYDNNNPGTPYDYSKEKIGVCDYRIKFKTADDHGLTEKVEIYRSDSSSFNADSGTRIAGINIGSNQSGEITNSVPDCNKTYYFALRAISPAGNASDLIGDREVSTTIINPTPNPAVASGLSAGTVLGQASGADTAGLASPAVLGDQSASPEPETTAAADTASSGQIPNWIWWVLGLAALGIGARAFLNRKSG